MKKALKIVGIVLVIGVIWYGARWAYYVNEYKQHLPRAEIIVDGVEREYYLFTPANEADGPSPLLVTLQGGGADAGWRFASQYDWEALAEKEGMIIALPSGKQLGDNEGAWQLNTDSESMQDIDYFEAMISEISSKYTVDASRLYAVGYSLGSMFSYELACQMSTRFAAIASFAGTMPVAPKSCDPERNIPIMHVHGVEDPIIAYANTWDWKAWDSVGTMRDIPGLVQYWTDKYNCQNKNETSSESVTHFVYDACDQDSRIEHYRLENGTHDWPADINGEPTYNVMWSFLSKHSLL
jgi:polyhydroxybutyrate depolymerase